MGLETFRFDIQDFLKTPEDRAGILEAAREDGDPELIAMIIEDIREAERRNGSGPDAPKGDRRASVKVTASPESATVADFCAVPLGDARNGPRRQPAPRSPA
ncbi:hypothetical protein I6F15_00085 [Bradyrhizobium sp. BRP14]|nr:hypothetical protein [Bradyrhizobium sp. BRP14]